MKIIRFETENNNILKVVCKKGWNKNHFKTITTVTDLKMRGLPDSYLGWSFDKDNNIIFRFVLRNYETDLKPYIEKVEMED